MPNTPKSAINLKAKLDQVSKHWSPKIVSGLNNYHVKVAKLQGEFVWHKHDDTDELFHCLQGELTIEMRDGDIHLRAGDLYVVPKGVEHRPVAHQECHVVLIEPDHVINTGDAGGDLTAPNDEWI